MTEHDAVDHPRHYTSDKSGVECIQITRHRNFNIGNAIKYLWRQGLKESASTEPLGKQIEDLEKARWYIADEIARLQVETAPQADREKAEEWIAAVDSGEAGYCSFGEHPGGGDALAAKINSAAAAVSGFIVGLKDEGAPQAGDPITIRRVTFAPPAEHLAPVTDLTARRARTHIHSSPCTCKTDGTVA